MSVSKKSRIGEIDDKVPSPPPHLPLSVIVEHIIPRIPHCDVLGIFRMRLVCRAANAAILDPTPRPFWERYHQTAMPNIKCDPTRVLATLKSFYTQPVEEDNLAHFTMRVKDYGEWWPITITMAPEKCPLPVYEITPVITEIPRVRMDEVGLFYVPCIRMGSGVQLYFFKHLQHVYDSGDTPVYSTAGVQLALWYLESDPEFLNLVQFKFPECPPRAKRCFPDCDVQHRHFIDSHT